MLPDKYHKTAADIKKAVEKATNILVISHKNPDGDTMGAATALYDALVYLQKRPQLFCVDEYPADFFFLPNFESLTNYFQPDQFDLVFVLDCGANYMTGIHNDFPELFYGRFPLINIDHHTSNDNFGLINLIDTSACSTTLIMTELFRHLNIPVTHRMATALLCGIFTDTGSFQHSNTDSRSFRAAAFLLRSGAALYQISKNIFRTFKLPVLKLWGRVLSRVHVDNNGATVSYVLDDDFQETNTSAPDLSGVVDFLNSVPDANFSLLLTQINGKVKASFRTMRDDVDVAKIASTFGGGGHKKAAGFTMPGKLEKEVRWKIVKE